MSKKIDVKFITLNSFSKYKFDFRISKQFTKKYLG